MGDYHGLMRGLINLGVLYIQSENPDQALTYLEKALQQAMLSGEEAETAKIYLNIGIAHRLRGEPSLAEAYARKAEKIFKQFSNLVELAKVWSNLGLACLDQRKWEEARHYLEASLETWRKLKNQYGKIRSLIYLVEYQLARGNQRRAVTQLSEVKSLIEQHRHSEFYGQLQTLLAKYCHTLDEYSTQTSEVLATSEV
jgi:tetratricopeptide (TPR) repeat protein